MDLDRNVPPFMTVASLLATGIFSILTISSALPARVEDWEYAVIAIVVLITLLPLAKRLLHSSLFIQIVVACFALCAHIAIRARPTESIQILGWVLFVTAIVTAIQKLKERIAR